MHFNFCKLISLLLSIPFISCSCFLFPDFKIESFSYNENFIKIDFNSNPDIDTIIDSFTMLEDEIQTEGNFSFKANSFEFHPVNGISKEHDYKIIITTDAEDTSGISLKEKYTAQFSTKSSNKPLQIQNFKQTLKGLEIDFSTSLDHNQFLKSFSISPAIDFTTDWNESSSSVKINFLSSLSINTRYFVSISKDLKNNTNNNLQQEFSYTFIPNYSLTDDFNLIYVSQNNETLILPEKANTNLSYKDKFYFSFFNNEDKNSFPASISIYPEISFKIRQSSSNLKNYYLELQEKPEYNSVYDLHVSYNPGNSDKPSEKNYILQFDSIKDCPPEFCNGYIKKQEKPFLFSDINNTINFPVDSFPTISSFPSDEISIYFIFSSKNKESEIILDSVINNITISATNNCIEIDPYLITTILDEASCDNILRTSNIEKRNDTKYTIIKYDCRIQNKTNKGLIRIHINKTLCDSEANSLSKDFSFIFNKQ